MEQPPKAQGKRGAGGPEEDEVLREAEKAAERDLARAKEELEDARRKGRHSDVDDPFDRLGETKKQRRERDG